VGPQSTNINLRTIVEAALYCKGYIDGTFGSGTQAGLYSALTNMGIAAMAPYSVAPKVFMALLTMDAYVLVNNDDADVQAAQRWLNASFLQRTTLVIGPCDGHYSRSVQVALAQALQPAERLAGSVGDLHQRPGRLGARGHLLQLRPGLRGRPGGLYGGQGFHHPGRHDALFLDDSDAETVAARNALWTKGFCNSGIWLIGDVPNSFKDAVAQAFVDVVTELADR
jgi:hypothetical protein